MEKKHTEPYLSAWLHQRGYALGIPVSGVFELTARCNFNCPMCYVHHVSQMPGIRDRELSAGQWLDLARDARDAGMVFALLTGGEPLIRDDFFEIYHGMKELGLLVSLNSNGFLLNGQNLQKLLADPPSRINVSLYGGCNETYQNMCGVEAYHQVKENIAQIKNAGVDVSLNLCITPYNKDDLAQIYADAVALNVNVRSTGYMYPPVRVNNENYGSAVRLTPEDAAKYETDWDRLRMGDVFFAKRAREIYADLDEGCQRNPDAAGTGVSCRAGSTSFWITWDGKMLPCGMLTFPMANTLETGFGEAWQRTRRETAEIRMPKACADCANRSACGVCAAVCMTETGRFDCVPEYMCRKTEERIRLLREAGQKGNFL